MNATTRGVLLAIAVASLGWLAVQYSDGLRTVMAHADVRIFLLYLALAILVRCSYVLRWRSIDGAVRSGCSTRRLALARLAGDAVGALSPAGRLSGDPVRVLVCGERGGTRSRLAAGVALDRLVETFGNSFAAMAYVAVFWATRTGERDTWNGLGLAMIAGCFGLALSLVLMARGYRPLAPLYWLADVTGARWLRLLSLSLRRVERHVRDLVRMRPGLAVWAIAGSVLIEALTVAEYSMLFRAFGASIDLPLVMLSMLVGGIARSAPTPAGIGAFEASQVVAFGAATGAPELGFTIGIITRVHDLLWTAVGLAALLAAGMPLTYLRSSFATGKATAA